MRLILVPVANRPECDRALQTAFDIAKRHGASVYGCHIRRHRSDKRQAAAKRLYERVAEQNGFEVTRRARKAPSAIWAEKLGSPNTLMGIVGPVSDLIVVTRPRQAGGIADDYLKAALTHSGRPVLVLPRASRKRIGDQICIGWDQSKHAASAVKAAMPMLQQAKEVTIVSCGPEDKPGPKSTHVAAYLKRWSVKTKRVHTRGRDVESELLAACGDADADLLIGGAYSRSRWRQKVLGGTTEFLVRKAKIPVLLLHS